MYVHYLAVRLDGRCPLGIIKSFSHHTPFLSRHHPVARPYYVKSRTHGNVMLAVQVFGCLPLNGSIKREFSYRGKKRPADAGGKLRHFAAPLFRRRNKISGPRFIRPRGDKVRERTTDRSYIVHAVRADRWSKICDRGPPGPCLPGVFEIMEMCVPTERPFLPLPCAFVKLLAGKS